MWIISAVLILTYILIQELLNQNIVKLKESEYFRITNHTKGYKLFKKRLGVNKYVILIGILSLIMFKVTSINGEVKMGLFIGFILMMYVHMIIRYIIKRGYYERVVKENKAEYLEVI